MNSDDYREILGNFVIRAKLCQSIAAINRKDPVQKLLSDLDDTEFAKKASVGQLYDLRGRLFQLKAFCNGVVKAIDESGLNFLGEFDDNKMDLSIIGITNRNLICTKMFTDHFSNLTILKGTEIEIVQLSYANVSNMIKVSYKKLITSTKEQESIDIPEGGKKITLLNLKILTENFKQVEKQVF